MALISTKELLNADFDVFLEYDGETVSLYGKHPQADGSCLIELEHADASGGRFSVEVASQDMAEPIWDYDPKDC